MEIKEMNKQQLLNELDKLGYELDLNDLTKKDLAEISVAVDESLDVEVVKRRNKAQIIKDLKTQGIEVELDSLDKEDLQKILQKALNENKNIKEEDLPQKTEIPKKREELKEKKLEVNMPFGCEGKKVTSEELIDLEKKGILVGYNPLNKIAIFRK